MAAYSTSTSTLQDLLKNPALDLDHVEKTTEELAEVMASQEEVDSAIRIGGQVAIGAGGQEIDDEDLRAELEGMVKEEKEKELESRRVTEREKEKEKIAQTPTQKPVDAVPAQNVHTDKSEADAERVWRERYEEAQQRKKEEAQRAETERMRKQEKMAAE